MEGVGWRVWGGGWRVKDGGWRVEGEGWRVEGGGWRVEGGGRGLGACVMGWGRARAGSWEPQATLNPKP